MAKTRVPTSKSSWIGMAAHEIGEITSYGASRSARQAHELADTLIRRGHVLLDTGPRETAQLNYSAEALLARRQAAAARQRDTARILGDDNMAAWLSGSASDRLPA